MVTEKEAEEKLMYCGRCAHFDLLKEEEMESRVYREAKYTHLDQHLTLADCRKTEKNPSGSIVMKECYRKGTNIWHLDGTAHVYDMGEDTGYTAEVFLTCDKTYRYEAVIRAEGTVSAPDETLAKRCAEFYSVLKFGMTEDDPQIIKIEKA